MIDNMVEPNKWARVLQGKELGCYKMNKIKVYLAQELTNTNNASIEPGNNLRICLFTSSVTSIPVFNK